jgi:hypothetical protein
MQHLPNETLLTVVLLAFGGYFGVLLVGGLLRYLRFRRVRRTALLTWPERPSARLPLLVALGLLAAGVAVLNGGMQRPLSHVLSQAVMASYFLLMTPLLARIQPGLYRDGVWAEGGFLPYAEIGRLAFFETPEIMLVLLPKGGWRGVFKLLVPPNEYPAVRRLLEEQIRARVLRIEEGILGLGERS